MLRIELQRDHGPVRTVSLGVHLVAFAGRWVVDEGRLAVAHPVTLLVARVQNLVFLAPVWDEDGRSVPCIRLGLDRGWVGRKGKEVRISSWHSLAIFVGRGRLGWHRSTREAGLR
uniref:(northern house mosquito) hypothetical protein n=1 Tax=Culex pipiens TaxID=7175 RepID=A0A8D8CM32_CULPI